MFKDQDHHEHQAVSKASATKYKSYTLRNLRSIPQLKEKFSERELFEMEVVANVLPFKANNYVVDELIDWQKVPDDPIFILTFPQKDMLVPRHFKKMYDVMKRTNSQKEIVAAANEIRMELNPHPAGQIEHNQPILNGKKLDGVQHKYSETVLFFPKQSQTCHAYCTFCFRWPQFIGIDELKFATKDVENLIEYLKAHPEVSDLLITGGDPMVLSTKNFDEYISAILDSDLPNLKNIRIGSKSLSYWPYKFVDSPASDQILKIIEKIQKSGKLVAFMAHFNHFAELKTEVVQTAIKRLLSTGVQIRTQAPVLRKINDSSVVWSQMWQEQVRHRCIPYYMFMPRDTGAHHFFGITLEQAWNIFREAYSTVSGLARTVRGPIMSCGPGKIQFLGINTIIGQKVMVLRFLQGRKNQWVQKPFFAEYNPEAEWIGELKPAFGEEKFFFENELKELYTPKIMAYQEED